MTVYPDYYPEFRCIAGACSHNCCIGWEIDIDADKLAFYETVPGELGQRLRRCISREGTPHFILGEGERCPFLNGDNLCDIITQLGEEHICQICTDHPRFYNCLSERTEAGLGLCCEEAARLILGWKEPVRLLKDGDEPEEDEWVLLRDEAIALLQRREKPIWQRLQELLALCGGDMPHGDMSVWADALLQLERLDDGWTQLLEKLKERWHDLELAAFDAHMAGRETEYEQLAVYLVYRHLVNAWDDADLAARAAFAVLGCLLLRALGALMLQESGDFTFAHQVELARMFSSEIEYSEENMEALLRLLLPAWAADEMN